MGADHLNWRQTASMPLANGGAIFGILLMVGMVISYLVMWALWYFVFREKK